MKELKEFLENVEKGKDGYKLGDPWKFSKNSMGVIVPILRDKTTKRDYITLPEVKDKVKFSDTGSIREINVKGVNDNLFIRAGSILEGEGTQPRATTHSIILEPKIELNLDVRCIERSHPIMKGSGFKYRGYTPRIVTQSLHKGNQSGVWGSVKRHGKSSYLMAMANSSLTPDEIMARQMERSVDGFYTLFSSDSLPEIKKAQQKLDTKLQDILKEVPALETQVGAIIVGVDGIEGIESFDHPDSWKAQYKEVIESYSDTLSEESKKLFTFDDSAVNETIKDFLQSLSKAKTIETYGKKHKTYQINLEGYIGELATVNSHIIHLFLLKAEKDEPEPQPIQRPRQERRRYEYNRPRPDYIYRDRPIYRFQPYHIQSLSSGMKKGYKGIINTIDEYGEGATWGELENKLCKSGPKPRLSSATLQKRIMEGKQIGLIGESIRHKNGKKIYTLRNIK